MGYVHRFISLAVVALAAVSAMAAGAEPTEVTVRVLSRGGGFIGNPAGGAEVTLRDARTGELLARGRTEGSPGDIERIMGAAAPSADSIATDEAAQFTATLALERPRLVEVTAQGPMGQDEAANRVSATQWVVPGRHLTGGDGWLLVIPGLTVAVDEAPAEGRPAAGGGEIPIAATVKMMCGCPIKAGGRWDAADYEVAALVYRDGELVGEQALTYAGEPSRFSGSIPADQPGRYEVAVFAHQTDTGNTGVDRFSFAVEAPAGDPVAAAMKRCASADKAGESADTDLSAAEAALRAARAASD